MNTTDIIFSINVHEKLDFLLKQLKNINDNVSLKYVVIINPNDYMYNEISNCDEIMNNKNIILNKNYLDKRRHHGSLTKGIYYNMKYAINNYNFKFFIILSSRNLFYNKLTSFNNIIDSSLTDNISHKKYNELNLKSWHWNSFTKTKLGLYIINNDLYFDGCAHEGLTFNNEACIKIIDFIDKNNEIAVDLFNWNHCVEEFALQSICINLKCLYYNIGNGCDTNYNINNLPKNKLVYKTLRI